MVFRNIFGINIINILVCCLFGCCCKVDLFFGDKVLKIDYKDVKFL